MQIEQKLKGKVALITGGGSGIGAAISKAYSASGAAIVVTARRPDPLNRVVNEIIDSGGRALAVTADVTSLDTMEAAASSVLAHFGRLDIVVANAGGTPGMGPVIDCSPKEWREVIELNLTGVWHTAKVTVPILTRAGGGHIIVVGSGAGRANNAGAGAYIAAKAGVMALVRVLALELRAAKIAVNELVPGPVDTEGFRKIASSGDTLAKRMKSWDEWVKEPESVAELALYLAALPVHGPTGQVFSLAAHLL